MGAIITSTTKEFFACNIDLVYGQFFALLFIAKLHTHPMNLKPIILLFIPVLKEDKVLFELEFSSNLHPF